MIKILHLLQVIDAYQEATGLTDGTIGTYVFNDGKQVKRLRSGKDIIVGRFNDALRWFSDHWPEGAVWPEGISRPVVDDGDCREDAAFRALKRRHAARQKSGRKGQGQERGE